MFTAGDAIRTHDFQLGNRKLKSADRFSKPVRLQKLAFFWGFASYRILTENDAKRDGTATLKEFSNAGGLAKSIINLRPTRAKSLGSNCRPAPTIW